MTQDDRPEFWELLTLDELRERYSVRGELDGLSPKEQEDRLEFIRWCMAIGILEEDGTSWMGHSPPWRVQPSCPKAVRRRVQALPAVATKTVRSVTV